MESRFHKQPHNGKYCGEYDLPGMELDVEGVESLVVSVSISTFHHETRYLATKALKKTLRYLAHHLLNEAGKL